MSTNYGQVRPLTVAEKQAFDPIIYDFEQATGANLDRNSVAIMSDEDTEEIMGYHMLSKSADSSNSQNLISAIILVDSSGENSRATILGTYISSINGSISSISVRNKSLDVVSESITVTPMKYPTVPSTQSSNTGTTMLATPSISNLKNQNGHLTGTIDVTVGGIFSWDIIGFDINLNNRSLDWWWIK